MFFNNLSIFVPKALSINWIVLIISMLLVAIGSLFLYSAAGGSYDPWSKTQMLRYSAGICLFMYVSSINIRFWLSFSYIIYFISLLLLILVYVIGDIGMGAQRWLDLGFVRIQPSELMKFSLILLIARYYHSEKVYGSLMGIVSLICVLVLVAIPAYLIYIQPDLGGSIILILVGITLLFIIGLSIWFFLVSGLCLVLIFPLIWIYFLQDYQQDRILTFLDPSKDPLGAGYHIMQSKIALGSGGFWGRGFMKGSQSQLNFLPEKQTDFILTLIAEELGMIGSLFILILYFVLIFYSIVIGLISKNIFGSFLCIGIAIILFYSVFINAAMVMGLLPVVGAPLPLISYGGSSLLSTMFGLGLISNVYVNRNITIERYKAGLFGW
jgi:rod shape determining protein RodA